MKIGLALGGGFTRAGAHIGVLKVLEEYGISINEVSGVSSGAIVAGCYATNNLERLEGELSRFRGRDYLKLFKFRPSTTSLSTGQSVEEYFDWLVDSKTFDEADKTVYMAAADLISGEHISLNDGYLGKGMRAACSLPFFLNPVEHLEMHLVDGGLVIDFDSESLYRNNDFVIGVHVSYDRHWFNVAIASLRKKYWELFKIKERQLSSMRKKEGLNIIDVSLRSLSVTIQKISEGYYKSEQADFIVKPNVGNLGRCNIKKIPDIVRLGEMKMREEMPRLVEKMEQFKRNENIEKYRAK